MTFATITQSATPRCRAILHKRHGWIEAPEGAWIQVSRSGRSYELHETGPLDTSSFYPYGTRWNATSVLACDEI